MNDGFTESYDGSALAAHASGKRFKAVGPPHAGLCRGCHFYDHPSENCPANCMPAGRADNRWVIWKEVT